MINWEMLLSVAAIIGVAITGVGLRVTWSKNGKEQRARDMAMAQAQATRDQKLKGNQDEILKRLDDDRMGLAALNRKQGEMTNHCTEVSTGFAGRILTAERDIKEIKQK